MHWTQDQINEYMQKFNKDIKPYHPDTMEGKETADPGPEENLRKKIVKYCDDHGYPNLFFPQTKDVQRFLPPGWPDGIIALPKGRVVFMELKAKDGYLKPKQDAYRLMFMHLGHEWYLVRSYKRFLEIINNPAT